MGSIPSTPADHTDSTDTRPALQRLLDPHDVLSVTATHPALLSVPSTSAETISADDSDVSLPIAELQLDEITPVVPPDVSEESPHSVGCHFLDHALARVIPAPLAPLLSTPAVPSGEETFAVRTAQSSKSAASSSSLPV